MGRSIRRIWLAAIALALVACSQGKGDPDASTAAGRGARSSSGESTAAAGSATTAVAAGRPGGTIDQAASVAIGTAIDGEMRKTDQTDFYRFQVTSKLRDLAVVRLQNDTHTLRPYIRFYDANRSQQVENYDNTAGASVERSITLEPGATFYVQVLAYNSTGKYSLSVTPKQAYDAHEPNDDALSATPGKIGVANEGSILDDRDADWFRISGASTKTVHVTLDNLSSTLRPYVKVYSSTKSQVLEKYDGTAGANLDFSVDIEPGKDFYLEVHPYNSAGKYRLTATGP